MALGIIVLSASPGSDIDLVSYLFGSIVTLSVPALIVIAVLDIVILLSATVFNRPLLAVAFAPEFARLRGLNVLADKLLLLVLIAIAVVAVIRIVGLILVLALLTLPTAIAALRVQSILGLILGGVVWGIAVCVGGQAAAFGFDAPAGPSIIGLAVILYSASKTSRR